MLSMGIVIPMTAFMLSLPSKTATNSRLPLKQIRVYQQILYDICSLTYGFPESNKVRKNAGKV